MTETSAAYGDRVLAIEPGGAQRVSAEGRHGRPAHLLWTWASPNLEFTTIFIGVLAASAWGQNFFQAATACAIGNGLAAVAHGLLSARGPKHGAPQMVLSRLAFGRAGNAVPAVIMALSAGVGWFAANSTSGAFSLASLTGLPVALALLLIVAVQIALAFAGHNLVQAFERWTFPVLFLIFLLASVFVLRSAAVHIPLASPIPQTGTEAMGFFLTVGASFGYSAGWTPYAADYTRYLPREASRVRIGLASGLGLFLSCTALEVVGAASTQFVRETAQNPAHGFTSLLPGTLAAATLAAFALGSVAANALNLYSAALTFTGVVGERQRTRVVLAMGVAGGLAGWAALADPAASYESFLLLIGYWVGPWLGVVLMDAALSGLRDDDRLLYDRSHRNQAGLAAFLIALPVSVLLFANQRVYVGPAPRLLPALGDIAAFVGAVLAAGIMWAWVWAERRRQAPIQQEATG
ncbi:purine-cytosine permease family protein [Segniliparus rugosus]|uniref:Cytosine permease n=1 Tax=Segniliparus rugosus (strain ATCC BAA-974 / DSM 45345 / CCUG 50838 / CIP 108380 / JCM 13579 / CDC 945) TaxID=679197 RepID=E5XUZ2_SEGRC|nr:cytosine permease [Segniliparus rugosus]EFV11828.1 hypothetical protein HMPREF9336_03314 [Segniliparus rugosus ATCC BAA-974]